jgi:lipase chaperone LimK
MLSSKSRLFSGPMLVVYVLAALTIALYLFVFHNWAPASENKLNIAMTPIEHVTNVKQDVTHRDRKESEQILPYVSKLGALPESLDGSQMHMQLAVDESGHLRISSDLKDLMDFFLSAIDDEDLELILARIDEYLEYQLEEPALSEARAAMNAYIDLKLALYDLEQELAANRAEQQSAGNVFSSDGLVLLEEQLLKRNALRAELLSPEMHEAFYARSEAYDAFMLTQFKIKADPNLDAEQKQQMLEQSELNADPEIIASRRASMPVQILNDETERLLRAGGSDEDVRQLRTDMYGEEAAQRLSELDMKREEWDGRVAVYFASKTELLENSGLSGPELDSAMLSLRSEMFSDAEQVRIKVMEGRKGKN